MTPLPSSFLLSVLLSLLLFPALAQKTNNRPVTPGASPEARALLKYIQGLSGRHILAGQHNFPLSGARNSEFAAGYIGKMPPVWSQDFGFAADGDKDSYLARPDIIREAIRQHRKGSIVTLCWHAVPPTADEPVTFQPLPGYDSTALASVQGKLTDQQFRDLLTPGTELHGRWQKQVDTIAFYLRQLQEAKVPVLWRPYHEMNGDWFWWGGRHEGTYTTAALYRQIFNRMAKHHKLDNLIWVWSVDRPSRPDRTFDKYYPGDEYLDILSLDVYGNDFNQAYYDSLAILAKGRPVALGEVGNPPSLEILGAQPNWVYWVVWSGMVRGTPQAEYEKLAADPRVVFMEDSAYLEGTKEYRRACGLEPVTIDRSADFTGEWLLNECESSIDDSGPGRPPYRLNVVQQDDRLTVQSVSVVEWADDELSEQTLRLDGSDVRSTAFNNAPRVQNAWWSPHRDTLTIDSRVTFNFNNRPTEVRSRDLWTLQRRGKRLVIHQKVESPRGVRESTLVYERRK